ncbi:MAG: glutathionylspermidine synthase family protein [Treponema sp.]|nr:glutathionylspermidine synthase family protein [Treponema sp.]
MNAPLRFAALTGEQYPDYRLNVIFKGYKWDPMVGDQNTIAKYVLIVSKETAQNLGQWAEQLSKETMLMEEALIHNLPLAKELGLPKKILKVLPHLSSYKPEQHIRLMRFDFHPVLPDSINETGWAVSEVNSDVPGGLAEASVLPEIACQYVDATAGDNVAAKLLKAFQTRIKHDGNVAFVHATSYSDDRQVMQFLGDYFDRHDMKSVYAAPDHLKWESRKAFSIIKGQECAVAGIVRFFPLEWLVNLPEKSRWQGYYDCNTSSCNHPVAIFAQSKRLPLVWNLLGIDVPAWKRFLPETCDPRHKTLNDDNFIFKPALGRVGEGVSIRSAISEKEMIQINKAVKKEPENWILQRCFKSIPIKTGNGEEYHVCIGVFTVDGKRAGFYGRISPYPRIDAGAIDIPILIEKDN